MKNIVLFTLLLSPLLSLRVFGQSTTVTPSFIQIPATAAPTTCSAATKGKQYFNTTSNKMFYCNGSVWVEYAAVAPVAFMAYYNSVGVVNNEFGGALSMTTEVFDEGNDHSGGVFTVPENGVYHFNVSMKWGTNNATTNYTLTALQKCDNAGLNCVPLASSKMYNQVAAQQAFGVDAKLEAGQKIRVFIYQSNSSNTSRPIDGVVDADGNKPIFFSGHLVK